MSNRIRRGTVMPEPRRIAIEQTVARGWSTGFITERLGITAHDVERVLDYLNTITAEVLDEHGHVIPSRCTT